MDAWLNPDPAGLPRCAGSSMTISPVYEHRLAAWQIRRLGGWTPSTQDMVTFHQPSVTHGLSFPAPRTCEQGAAGHCLQLRHLRMGDVLAVVATHADGIYAVKAAVVISCCIKGENAEKSCIGHCGVPSIFCRCCPDHCLYFVMSIPVQYHVLLNRCADLVYLT